MRLLPVFLPTIAFALLACSAPSQIAIQASDFNQATLQAITAMPKGGGYSGSDTTKNKLSLAYRLEEKDLIFSPEAARPSFCSGATYLVFLKALQSLRASPPTEAQNLVVANNQKDGSGVFGRWNSNGPGCAKLVHDLGCGSNFTSWDKAQPGDFLKIWWTDKIGGQERGHHVVYLGHDKQSVRFWSSNQPNGYGEKTIPRADCKRVLFTRINAPEKANKVVSLPPSDPWLERMLRDDFTWAEVKKKCRVQD